MHDVCVPPVPRIVTCFAIRNVTTILLCPCSWELLSWCLPYSDMNTYQVMR